MRKAHKPDATFKYNNGDGALLCEECRTIIKVGNQFTEDEWKALRREIHLAPQYCNKHKK
jgi:hypothetical protein